MKANTIHCGDCCELLESARPGFADLVFADPPFNIGYVYDKYRDDLPDADYVAWTRRWMAACVRAMKASGSFYIAIGDEFAADIRIIGRELGLHLRNWIIWRYTFGQNARTMFSRAHTHIFYFVKDRNTFTFNDHLLRYPSARHTEYQDLRADPRGRVPDDVWEEFPRVCGTFKERKGFHGCQMPEALLARIVLASSNPGDIVLDPFVGSGTTAAAAKRWGRKYVGIDLSPEYVQHVQQRLASVRNESRLPRNGDHWPDLHHETLLQLFRETKVARRFLVANEVALRVIAASLSERVGCRYEAEDVRRRLESIPEAELPKLPNDRVFVARKHTTTEGKKYVRKVFRVRARRTGDGKAGAAEQVDSPPGAGPGEAREAI